MHVWRWLCGFLTVLLVASVASAGDLKIAFTDKEVRVEGLTPGGQAVWLSVAREKPSWITSIVRRDGFVADDDKDGQVRIEYDDALSRNSAWVVVDFETGDYAFATPEGMNWREVDFPAKALARDTAGAAKGFVAKRGFVELLFVRPGIGAWGLPVCDGSVTDEDRPTQGVLQVSLSRLRPLKGTAADTAPEAANVGDVMAAIDVDHHDVMVVRLGAQ